MSLFTATSFWNIQPVAVAGQTFSFRSDPYSASLLIACPYSTFSTLGMTNFYDNCAGAIRTGTFSNGYKLVPTGSNVGTAGPQFYPSSSQFVNSGSFNFSTSGGYSTALLISGSQNAGTITTAAASIGSNSFVMECWVNLKGGTFTSPPFNMFFFGDGSGDYLLYDYANGASAFRGFINAGNAWSTTPSWAAKTNNVWYHLAYVKSGTNMYVYWNGNRIGNGTRAATVTNPPSAFWRILGLSEGNNSNGYAKLVQDFRFYVGTDKGWTGATITPSDSIVVVS
jgi:hypothetical protein